MVYTNKYRLTHLRKFWIPFPTVMVARILPALTSCSHPEKPHPPISLHVTNKLGLSGIGIILHSCGRLSNTHEITWDYTWQVDEWLHNLGSPSTLMCQVTSFRVLKTSSTFSVKELSVIQCPSYPAFLTYLPGVRGNRETFWRPRRSWRKFTG